MRTRSAATISRYDYAKKCDRARTDPPASTTTVVIAKPREIVVRLETSYAAELLEALRVAERPRRGELSCISIGCPVEIMVDAATLRTLIDELESQLNSSKR